MAVRYITNRAGETFEVLIDDADTELYDSYKWHVNFAKKKRPAPYVRSYELQKYFHRLLMEEPTDGIFVDHINGNSLDNRRSNLRLCNVQQNNWNTRRSAKRKYSPYRGVKYNPKSLRNPWVAKIYTNGQEFHLGCYSTPEEAAMIYDLKAKEFFGEYAALNNIDITHIKNTAV